MFRLGQSMIVAVLLTIILLQTHKNAWPFLEAVDPGEAPEYYKVVSQPIDLRTVENRVKQHHYKKLASFIGESGGCAIFYLYTA